MLSLSLSTAPLSKNSQRPRSRARAWRLATRSPPCLASSTSVRLSPPSLLPSASTHHSIAALIPSTAHPQPCRTSKEEATTTASSLQTCSLRVPTMILAIPSKGRGKGRGRGTTTTTTPTLPTQTMASRHQGAKGYHRTRCRPSSTLSRHTTNPPPSHLLPTTPTMAPSPAMGE